MLLGHPLLTLLSSPKFLELFDCTKCEVLLCRRVPVVVVVVVEGDADVVEDDAVVVEGDAVRVTGFLRSGVEVEAAGLSRVHSRLRFGDEGETVRR